MAASSGNDHETVKPLSEVDLSERDIRNLASAYLSLHEPISGIDMDVFTTVAGYGGNVTNARKRLGESKKRAREVVFNTSKPSHVFSEGGGRKSATPGGKKTNKATGQKRKTIDMSDDEEDLAVTPPSRKNRVGTAKMINLSDDEDEAAVTPLARKYRARAAKTKAAVAAEEAAPNAAGGETESDIQETKSESGPEIKDEVVEDDHMAI